MELKLRVAPAEGAAEAPGEAIKGVEMWRKWKLGKGMVRALGFWGRSSDRAACIIYIYTI